MILKYQGQTDEKETVLEYINNGFLKKDGVFASHPLLLTYVTMNYPTYKRFHSDHLLFYKSTYEALLSGHDDNKKPYDRVFMSVDNADQFSKVFKEFCGITYKDGVLQLDSPLFEEYFNKLKSHKGFENPHKMNLTNFKHDVCSTACMMYEKEYDIFYIDPGFQEYLFAEYYRSAEIEDIQELTVSLKKTPYSKFLRFDALDMLSKSAELKFKTYVLMPFLDAICKGNDETGFINFINTCFNEINVVNVDEVVKAMYLLSSGATELLYPQVENHPKTVLLNYVMKCMGVDHEFPYCLYAKDNVPKEGSIKKVSISEDTQISGVLIGRDAELEGEKRLLIDCKPVEVYSYYNSEQSKGNSVGYYVGTDNQLIQFGSELTIDTYFISTEPEEYKDLMLNVIDNSKTTYDMFKRVKQFYKRLKIELHRNGQM